ncbi:MAG: methyltransferase domain-containing protein [Bacteroidetes bacterium]|nr:methyltransferase domain-containing protein [Bacteroidota bacterium]
MTKDIVNDIIDWDITNWSKTIDYWSRNIDFKDKNFKCLELGGRKGGLSLWLAIDGHNVICSDLEPPEKYALELHRKYEVQKKISYQSIDATKIPYDNFFDIIVFKSILGGISRNNRNELKKKTIDEIHKALKPAGVLLFAENIEGSFMHKFLRKKFVSWGNEWNYLKINELDELFSSYKSVKYITVGFFGAFGRSKKQRNVLGKFDRLFERIVPRNKRYILIGIAEK